MNYMQAVDYINSMLKFGSKLGLERISMLLEKLGNPQKSLKFIHVAGTNGKGSICAYTASIFMEAGYKTGLFTSPYVLEFRERFQINSQMIEKDELASLTEELKVIVNSLNEDELPTEFEFITALAMVYFYRNHCDVVVLEVGLGGKYDSTNIIDTPLCSVIGSIGLDHTAILGDTVAKIAEQKAGIIKPSGKTVCYPIQDKSAYNVIKDISDKNNNQFIIPDTEDIKIVNESISGDTFCYKNLKLKLSILGKFQPYNAATAIEAVRAADGFNITDKNILNGVKKAKFPARCEVLGIDPIIIMDGAHNPDGVIALADVMDKYLKTKPVAVIGMMADKDVETVMSVIAPRCAEICTVTVDNPRSMSADRLKQIAAKYCTCVEAQNSVEAAIDKAFLSGQPVLVCGSFYLAATARKYIIKRQKKI